ncbi:MAG: aminotransferase class IV [Sedimentisphaerales bacterium]
MQLVMIDDKFVDSAEVDPANFDFGTFFGDGVYEFLRSYNGKIFALDEHLERFQKSLSEIEIDGIDIEVIRKRVLAVFEKYNKPNVKIYFHVTRGAGIRDHAAEGLTPRFFLTIAEIEDAAAYHKTGIKVISVPDTRWKRCDIKSLNLLPNVLAKRAARRQGCAEAIFVDDKGYITEGAASAFFAVFGNVLKTAPLSANILPSVTRHFTLQLASNVGLKVDESQVRIDDIAKADELLQAVSSKDVTGIIKFDDITIGDGRPGKYAKLLAEEFEKLVK